MTLPQMRTRYRAATMELVAYLDERCVEMHIVTDCGESIAVVCARDSILKVERQIARMGRECPEIATWGEGLPRGSAGLPDAAPPAAAPPNRASRAPTPYRQAALALMPPALLLVLALLVGAPAAAEPIPQTERFQFQPRAQKHCPTDIVVWVNVRSQIYNSKEERWYGQTAGGAFVCRRDAEKAGYRAKPQS